MKKDFGVIFASVQQNRDAVRKQRMAELNALKAANSGKSGKKKKKKKKWNVCGLMTCGFVERGYIKVSGVFGNWLRNKYVLKEDVYIRTSYLSSCVRLV